MPESVVLLDAKIRKTAREALEKELRAITAQFNNFYTGFDGRSVAVTIAEGTAATSRMVTVEAHHAMSKIEDALFTANAPLYEKRAVEFFLQKVESIQSQLDDLKQGALIDNET